jgi:2-polyprenyl-3-methyl-5-hydroxy-6-metoxy-1,4-benzoquinol methylase
MAVIDRDAFSEASVYSRPVDRKKLSFFYDAISAFATETGRRADSMDALEIGCAAGAITLPLAAMLAHVDAVDIDVEALAKLRARLSAGEVGNVEVLQHDGAQLEGDRAYDVIVASEVFEHVTDPERLAGQLSARLRSPGLALITTPNGYGPYELADRHLNPMAHFRRSNHLRALMGRPAYVHGAGHDHAQSYTQRRLERLFAGVGLRNVAVVNSDALLTVLGGIYQRSERLGVLDIAIADRVPGWMASGWYMAFRRD